MTIVSAGEPSRWPCSRGRRPVASNDPTPSGGIYYRPAIPVTLALIAGILIGGGLPGFSPLFLCMLVAAAGMSIVAL